MAITDIVALRVVCPFLGDITMAEASIGASFRVLDVERKGSERSFREFGYESIHLLVELPDDLKDRARGLESSAVEIQLRTILQEAWAEVEHELVYKAEFTPFDEPMKRKLAALNATLSLSDIIFQEILDYQRRLTSELGRRRSAFYGKIEDAMESLSSRMEVAGTIRSRTMTRPRWPKGASSAGTGCGSPAMDDLLLSALGAHNREDYEGASRIYTETVSRRDPEKDIAAVCPQT